MPWSWQRCSLYSACPEPIVARAVEVTCFDQHPLLLLPPKRQIKCEHRSLPSSSSLQRVVAWISTPGHSGQAGTPRHVVGKYLLPVSLAAVPFPGSLCTSNTCIPALADGICRQCPWSRDDAITSIGAGCIARSGGSELWL